MTSSAESPLGLAGELDAQVAGARRRAPAGLAGRDLAVTTAAAAAFIVTATVLAVGVDHASVRAGPVVLLVLVYALVARVDFEIGSGSLVPTQLLLVPMLFVLPTAILPLAVAAGLVLAASVDVARGTVHISRLLVSLVYSWHAVGPALVLVAVGIEQPSWDVWPWLLLALAAEFAFDLLSALVREVVGVGVKVRLVLAGLGQVAVMDVLLTPVAFLAALEAADTPAAALAVVPLALLFQFLAFERRGRIDRTVRLSDAVQQADRAARTDVMTGLPNRLRWEEELVRAAALERVTVVIADVDGLKMVNDTLGHHLGDALIRAAAATLAEGLAGRRYLLARLGGDEFGCLVYDLADDGVEPLVVELREAFSRTTPLPEGIPVTACVGACARPPAPSLAAAIDDADRQMNEDKRRRGIARPTALAQRG